MLASESIKKLAKSQPDLPAVLANGQSISYKELWRDVVFMSTKIAAQTECQEGLAVVRMKDDYAQFVTVMAAHLAGLATMSLNAMRPFDKLEQRLDVKFHITDGDRPETKPRKFKKISVKLELPTPEEAQDLRLDMDCQIAQDSLIHIKITSGTTGEPKLIPLTRRQFEHWIGCYHRVVPHTRRARYLAVSGATQGLGLSRGMAAWIQGDLVIIEKRLNVFEAIALHHPDELVATPIFLYQFLRSAPEQYRPLNNPQIQIASGKLSTKLYKRAQERFQGDIICSYGMSERGTIGYSYGLEPGAEWVDKYRAVPWAEVEVVDANDLPVPIGTPGFVRVRVENMPTAYADDSEAAVNGMRDGWYYTRDNGTMFEGGVLQIEGRESELINLSGMKLYHPKIEDDLQHINNVDDAAVFSAPNEDGIEELCIAIVCDERNRNPVGQAVNAYLRKELTNIDGKHVVFLRSIPRNDSGKVMRRDLVDIFNRIRLAQQQQPAQRGGRPQIGRR